MRARELPNVPPRRRTPPLGRHGPPDAPDHQLVVLGVHLRWRGARGRRSPRFPSARWVRVRPRLALPAVPRASTLATKGRRDDSFDRPRLHAAPGDLDHRLARRRGRRHRPLDYVDTEALARRQLPDMLDVEPLPLLEPAAFPCFLQLAQRVRDSTGAGRPAGEGSGEQSEGDGQNHYADGSNRQRPPAAVGGRSVVIGEVPDQIAHAGPLLPIAARILIGWNGPEAGRGRRWLIVPEWADRPLAGSSTRRGDRPVRRGLGRRATRH